MRADITCALSHQFQGSRSKSGSGVAGRSEYGSYPSSSSFSARRYAAAAARSSRALRNCASLRAAASSSLLLLPIVPIPLCLWRALVVVWRWRGLWRLELARLVHLFVRHELADASIEGCQVGSGVDALLGARCRRPQARARVDNQDRPPLIALLAACAGKRHRNLRGARRQRKTPVGADVFDLAKSAFTGQPLH